MNTFTKKELRNEIERQMETISSGCEIIPLEEMQSKAEVALTKGRPLRFKFGIDPTNENIHIGHMVPIRKLRQMQDIGHTAVIIIGDVTAQIGDPTDRSAERTRLSLTQTTENAATYISCIERILIKDKTEIHRHSKWFSDFDLRKVFDLASQFSVAHLLTHETFRERLAPGKRLSLHELMYPILQAYDSIAVKPDVEVGGTDQQFNILCGRDLMRCFNLEPQVAMLMPLLPGIDGRKMSKSFDNHIDVSATPGEMYGRLMSVPDQLILQYFSLAAGAGSAEVDKTMIGLESGSLNPRDIKADLAMQITCFYHSRDEAHKAKKEFDRVFAHGELPSEIPEIIIGSESRWIVDILKECEIVSSSSDARRLIEQGGVYIDDSRLSDWRLRIALAPKGSIVIRCGRRNYIRIIRRA